jgi:RNA polymerase sigma factor (sigma-70 family)
MSKARNTVLYSAITSLGYRSVSAFCKANDLIYAIVNSLLCLRESPITFEGTFTPTASALMEILGAAPSDLWTDEQLYAKIYSHNEWFRKTNYVDVCANHQCTLTDAYLALMELPSPIEEYEHTALLVYLDELLDTVDQRERTVIERYYIQDCTMAEIADELSLTKQRIDQIRIKALHKLQHPSRTVKLLDYVSDQVYIKECKDYMTTNAIM